MDGTLIRPVDDAVEGWTAADYVQEQQRLC